MMLYVISLDWFQYFANVRLGFALELGTRIPGPRTQKGKQVCYYEVCAAEEFHAIYRKSVTMKLGGFPICHVHWLPKSSALDPHSCAIKVANRLLYSSTWSFHLHNVCDAIGAAVMSITRVDLCCDFTEFATGQKPTVFIHHYVRDTADQDTESYIRRGSNKFCVIGKKSMRTASGSTKISADSLVDSVVSQFDYLRFGTRASGVSTYLYNKSAELREKHSKPWIRQSWLDAGLIKEAYEEGETEPDVYRLELSIQAKGMNVRVKPSPESDFTKADNVRKLEASDFATQLALEETFWAYQARYFSFKICTGQKYRKDMKELQLFEPEIVPQIKPTYLNRATDSGVAERNAAAAIERLRFKTSVLTTRQQTTLMEAVDVLRAVGVLKKQDLIHGFSWQLDPEREWNVTKRQRECFAREIERRTADLLACFRDPKLATMVEEWEATMSVVHDLEACAHDLPNFPYNNLN